MFIEMDLTSLPPSLALRECDDFKGFKIVSERVDHAYIGNDALRELAGEKTADPAWAENFQNMIAYAQSKGWIREDGAFRAHIEWKDA